MSISEESPRPVRPTGEPQFPVVSTTPGILKLPNQESRSITPISATVSPAPLPQSTSPGPSDIVSGMRRRVAQTEMPLSQEDPLQRSEKVAQRILTPPKTGVEEQPPPSTGVSPAPETPSPEVEEESPEETQREFVEGLVGIGIPKPIVEQLVEGYEKDWKGFANEAGGWKQVHSIRGLKVYKDPATGHVVADYGLGTLGGGHYKRSKAMIRFNEDGSISYLVRYTGLDKEAPSFQKETFRQRFRRDIHRELSMREYARKAGGGAPVPNLLDITAIPYVNARGEPKMRYVAQRCLGTIYSL